MASRRNKYGGFLSPLLKGIVNAAVREIMVEKGHKTAHRGGARISLWKRLVYGKDRRS